MPKRPSHKSTNRHKHGDAVRPRLEAALSLQHKGALDEAEALYREILIEHPKHPDALHLMGLLMNDTGRAMQALELLSQAAALVPESAIIHNNLGEICRTLGRTKEAIQHLQRALSLGHRLPQTDRNIGQLLLNLGETDAALAHLDAAAALHPGDPGITSARATALACANRPDEALLCLQIGLQQHPDHTGLLIALSKLHRRLNDPIAGQQILSTALENQPDNEALLRAHAQLSTSAGRTDQAIDSMEKLLRLKPNDTAVKFDLASLRNEALAAAPQDYVRTLFDQYAPWFERHLRDRLEYQTPEQLASLLQDTHPERQDYCVLDLGCGTGLMADVLHGRFSRIDGIDLSPRMLDAARRKATYTRLMEGELVELLSTLDTNTYDLLTAADVLNYIGDLAPVFGGAARILPKQGLFLFSIETPAETSDATYRLDITGRFQHAPTHIETLAASSGLQPSAFADVVLRTEKDTPVNGRIYLMRKTIIDTPAR